MHFEFKDSTSFIFNSFSAETNQLAKIMASISTAIRCSCPELTEISIPSYLDKYRDNKDKYEDKDDNDKNGKDNKDNKDKELATFPTFLHLIFNIHGATCISDAVFIPSCKDLS